MMSLRVGLFTQVRDSGLHDPLVFILYQKDTATAEQRINNFSTFVPF